MSKKNKPLVSVIIPTYQRPVKIGRAIDSVLNQTYNNIEIIVVDDNDENSDYRKETEIFMRKYSEKGNLIYLKHKKNKNGAVARNTGIKNSRGKYISFLDDDDKYLPDNIERRVEKLESLDKSWGGVYSGVRIKNNSHTKDILPYMKGDLKKELLIKKLDLGTGSNLFFRSNVLEKLNSFDISFSRHQDLEFLIRFFRRWKIAYINMILVIKYNGYKKNKIKPDKLFEIKNKYLKKFRYDIGEFNKETQNLIYRNHYFEVVKKYLNQKKYKKGFALLKNIRQNYGMCFKHYAILFINIIDAYIPIKNILRSVIDFLKSYKLFKV